MSFDRPGWRAAAAVVAGFSAVPLVPMLFFAALSSSITVATVAALLLVLTGLPWLVLSSRAKPVPGGELVLHEHGLHVKTKSRSREAAYGEIATAWLAHGRNVFLDLANGERLEIALDDEDDAFEVLEALDAQGRTTTATLRPVVGAPVTALGSFAFFMFTATTISILLQLHLGSAWWVLTSLAGAAAAHLALRVARSRLIVGTDGVRVIRLRGERFIPFAQIASAIPASRQEATGILIHLRNGASIWLPTIGQPPARIQVIIDRIDAGVARSPVGISAAELLARDGRTVRAWREDLSRVAHAAGGFRQAAITPDDLQRIVMNPDAPVERRVGAAIALRVAEPEALQRVRVVTESVADERTRIALEAALADGSEDERDVRIERALEMK